MGTLNLAFKLNLASSKKNPKSEYVKQSKITYGTVIEENGIYKVSIDSDGNGTEKELILDFTPRSFDIVGRTDVFTKDKDKLGKRTRIIRSHLDAKFHYGSTEKYTPFAPNWIIKGYIVKSGNIRLFDFKELVGVAGYKNVTIIDD